MKRMRILMCAVWCLTAIPAASAADSLRVALMDFSTDENSYRSIQAAAEFTSLVQLGLMQEAGIEWVERAQISLAKQEFALAGAKAAGGGSPLQRGRMLGADWMIAGHFSSDDQSRATLAIQVIELKYADVIVEETRTLPGPGKEWVELNSNQVAFAVGALQSLLAKTRIRQRELANQARVAFLFLADTSSWPGSDRGAALLPREFSERLAQAAAANGRIRLVQFPKAYQSTEEAELAVDGIIAAGQDSWNRTADLYVWGTCAVTNVPAAGPRESWFSLALNLWNGIGEPITIKESFKMLGRGSVPPAQATELINGLVNQVISRARPQRSESDSAMVRKQIADSIVKAYVAMTGRNNSQLGLHDREKFVQAVHMLETACYFDPDNADARVLWVTCRYGWWIDFGFNVKNQFWTKWRRSQAWGNYVDRFGLKPAGVELPFPYQQRGIPETYVSALDEVVELFPQWDSMEEAKQDAAEEEQSRRQGVHTVLMEAEYHGFPKFMPAELTMKWKLELGEELVQRKQRVAQHAPAQRANSNAVVRGQGHSVGQNANQTPPSPPQQSVSGLPAQPFAAGVSPMVTTPAWVKNHMSIYGMFRLYPPNALPQEVKPDVQRIEFPAQFEVKVIRQLALHNGRLWILAMDQRSSPSSAAKPDLSGETREERNRLWRLEAEELKPELFKADSLPPTVNAFLFQGDQLWLAGDSVGMLELGKLSFRKFGLADGLAMQEVEALAVANGRVHAAGDFLKVSEFDPVALRWNDVPLVSRTGMSHGSDNPYLLAGHRQWLSYGTGAILCRDTVAGSWTNLAPIAAARCIEADSSAFWIGADGGLYCYGPDTQTLRSWNAPAFLESPMIGLGTSYGGGNGTLPQNELEQWDRQIRGRLRKMAEDRKRVQLTRKDQKEDVDPLRLSTRIPGHVVALANDGEFLWLGANNYFGSYLLLLHKPSLSLVASYRMAARGDITSLAVSDKYVWAGTAYGDNSLLRLRKDAFLSIPRDQWSSLTLTPKERERLIQAMNSRDQALYAYFAGDDRRVVQLLGGLDPEKASLEEMFLLAWSYDVAGVDDPQQSRRWFEQICLRHPGSPWADHALAAFQANDAAHASLAANALAIAKFDRNHDGKLEESEKQVMRRDPAFAKVQKNATDKQQQFDMQQIVKNYDQDGDHKLNQVELKVMRQHIASQLFVRKERPDFQSRSRLLDPLISDRVPPAEKLLPRYDADKDASLDAAELGVLAAEIRDEKN